MIGFAYMFMLMAYFTAFILQKIVWAHG